MPVAVVSHCHSVSRMCMRTCSLVDGQHWDASARAPCRQLTGIVKQCLQPILLSSFRREVQYDTQMLRYPAQTPHITSNELWGSVVVVKDSKCPIQQRMVNLTNPNDDGEDDVDDAEEQ